MKKKNHIKVRFSTILLCILAILLCAAPRGWAVDLDDGEKHDVREDIISCLVIGTGTTVNLYASVEQYVIVGPYSVLNIYSGGSVEQSVFVGPYGVLNIYSGSVGWYISLNEYADVTVFGTNFEVDWDCDGTFVSLDGADEFTPRLDTDTDTGSVVLKGTYGNGDSIELWFLSDIAIKLKAPDSKVVPMVVAIDIKPGGNPNNINPRSKGVVPVAVLTTGDFDASTIDPDTVEFAGAKPVRWKLEDVDEDGDLDMLFHFKTQDLRKDDENNPEGLDENSTEATLTATLIGTMTNTMTSETTAGEAIQGTDEVCIKPGKKKK